MDVDKLWRMIGGRKFLAWLGSTGLLVAGNVSQDNWLIVTLVFIGGTAAVDAIASLKGKKPPSPTVAAKAESEDELEP